MKYKYHQVVTLMLPGGNYFISIYRTLRSIPTVNEWNEFIETKAQEKQINKDQFVIINTMTLYHPD